jgi:hypothetical protein
MRMPPGPTLTILRIAGLAFVLVACAAFWVVPRGSGVDVAISVFAVAGSIAYLAPGIVLLLRRDWHVVGWLLCVFGLGMAASFSSDWGLQDSSSGPWWTLVQDLYTGSLFWLPMVALLAVFPDGLPGLSRGQARHARAVVGLAAAATLAELLVAEVSVDEILLQPNPLGIGLVPRSAAQWAIVVTFVALLSSFAGLVTRFRSAVPVARRQYRWVVSALVMLVVALAVGLVGSVVSGIDNGPQWIPILFAYLALPLAFMVAILRYRLYEIDRLVSRSVTYGVVVGVVAVVYVVVVGVLSRVVPGEGDLAVAGSTLAVAAVFSPVRRRVQGWVDRRFNRSRFDAGREVEAFSGRLGREVDLGVVEADLLGVVERTLQPSAAGLWMRDSGGGS